MQLKSWLQVFEWFVLCVQLHAWQCCQAGGQSMMHCSRGGCVLPTPGEHAWRPLPLESTRGNVYLSKLCLTTLCSPCTIVHTWQCNSGV